VAISGRPVAADLIGTTVTETNTYSGFTENLFDPANGYVPPWEGWLNTAGPTVTIAEPAIEFGATDIEAITYTATFNLYSTSVPEPSSLAISGLALSIASRSASLRPRHPACAAAAHVSCVPTRPQSPL